MTPDPSINEPEGVSRAISSDTRKFTARYDSLEAVREFVGRSASQLGFNPKNIYAVELATDEAFTNIVEHAYGGESNDLVEVTCKRSDEGLEITLFDCGISFDPTLVTEPDLDSPLEERETGGLGIFFMRKLMDDVHFLPASEAGGCNRLIMFKRKEKAV